MMREVRLRRTVPVLLGAVMVLSAAVACGSSSDETAATTTAPNSGVPTVSDVWARPALAGGTTAIYLSIHGGKTADELVEVSAPADFAESIEIHESVVVDGDDEGAHDQSAREALEDDNGAHGDGHDRPATTTGTPMRTMRPVDAVPIPAGGDVALAPGGHHVMVMGLSDALTVGDHVPIVLHFAEAGEIRATATVREM